MTTAPRIGLFGLLGSGNLGNDGSLQAVLEYLRAEHPGATVDCLCSGPERVRSRYGIPATALNWYHAEYRTASGLRSVAAKLLGKVIDAFRIAAWVRRHDAVMVPGMGVLEATLPLRPWGFPYSLALLCLSGRLCRTRVALVSVGADVISEPATRTLITWAARLASYRSYRDELSRTAMRRMGVDTRGDDVYPDLAFALPVPENALENAPAATGVVGVGVMAYHGGNGDRAHADAIHAAYVGALKRFVGRLVTEGRQVRLFVGDEADRAVVAEILAGTPAAAVAAVPASTLDDLMLEMAEVDTVVATRYHNVLCALKLAKPTLSIGYAAKNEALMRSMGQGGFCQHARSVEPDRLIEQFRDLERGRAEIAATLVHHNRTHAERLAEQFARLSSTLLPPTARRKTVIERVG